MKCFAVFAVAFLLSSYTLAQHQRFVADSDKSEIKMTLNTTREVVHGTFHLQSASVEFDRSDHAMSGSFVAQPGSGTTGNNIRDKRMHNEILKANQFTTMTFAPKSYAGTIAPSGDSTIQASGVFTLLGAPHDLTIPIHIHIDGSSATANAQFTIPYIQWGLKDPSFMFWKAQHEVVIDLNLIGQVTN